MSPLLYNIELLLFAGGSLVTLPLAAMFCLHTSALLLPRRRVLEPSPAVVKRLAIVVPAHNEASHIRRTLSSLIAAAEGSGAVIVLVAHNCTDETAEYGRQCGVVVKEITESKGGKGQALTSGFESAFNELGADAVMVVDADSLVSSNTVAVVLEELQAHRAIQIRYVLDVQDDSESSALRELAFTCFNQVRPLARQRLGISCGVFGNGFALRRELLEEVPYNAHSMVEDLELHLDLVRAGVKVQYVDRATVTAGIVQDWKTAETQTARWEGGRFNLLLKQYPSLLREIFRGEMRLVEPLLDLGGLPIALFIAVLILLALLPVHEARLYALVCFTLLLLHVSMGLSLTKRPGRYLSLLWYAPVYVVRKLRFLPSALRMARNNSRWKRTPRPAIEPKPQVLP